MCSHAPAGISEVAARAERLSPDGLHTMLARVARCRARFGEWNLKETDLLNTLQLITAKPTVYLINLTEKAYINKKNKWLIKARPRLRSPTFGIGCAADGTRWWHVCHDLRAWCLEVNRVRWHTRRYIEL